MRDQLSQVFSALSDPTRRAMLVRLAEGQATVSELAEPFLKQMSLPAVTKHLKVLEQAGLVTKGQDAQRRPCELNAAALQDAVDWMEQYRTFWEESFDRLGEYLKTVVPSSHDAKRKQATRKRPMVKQRKITKPKVKPRTKTKAKAKAKQHSR